MGRIVDTAYERHRCGRARSGGMRPINTGAYEVTIRLCGNTDVCDLLYPDTGTGEPDD